MAKVVTRFAPSPTGKPHVGNIRTAIFAYLWARHNNGKFLLRIEDTDRERLDPESQKYIEESLKWLGLEYDEEIIYQSKRKDIHKKYADQLVREGKAYKCFCSKERLEKLRQEQVEKKQPPGYDKHCCNLSDKEVSELEVKNNTYVIRFKMPEKGEAIWDDGVRGKMKIDFSVSDDQVIMKGDGFPTYHLAHIIDDHDAGVTDVIRGEEWISSTPKHIAIHNALGWECPKYTHMPHINGPDGSKLSKRHGDTAILDYRDKGYLSEAMLNFLTLIGWNDGTEKELFSREELISSFDIKRIGKAPAVFDLKKLDWISGQYVRASKTLDLKKQITALYPEASVVKLDNFDKILEVEKSRLAKLSDITKDTEFYVNLPKYNSKLLIFKKSDKQATLKGLEATQTRLTLAKWPESIDEFNKVLSSVVEKENLSNGDLFWPVRVALSGKENSPSPAELLWVLGKDESITRLGSAIEKLS